MTKLWLNCHLASLLYWCYYTTLILFDIKRQNLLSYWGKNLKYRYSNLALLEYSKVEVIEKKKKIKKGAKQYLSNI